MENQGARPNVLAARVKYWRERSNLGLRDVHRLTRDNSSLYGGVLTASYLSQVETGRILPSEGKLRILARVVGKREAYFLQLLDLVRSGAPLPATEDLGELVELLKKSLQTGEFDQAAATLTRAFSVVDGLPPEARSDELIARQLNNMAVLMSRSGQLELAQELHELVLGVRYEDSELEALHLCNASNTYRRLGINGFARAFAHRALGIAEKSGTRVVAISCLVEILLTECDYSGAEEMLRQALHELGDQGNEDYRASLEINLALCCVETDCFGDARDLLERAAERAAALGSTRKLLEAELVTSILLYKEAISRKENGGGRLLQYRLDQARKRFLLILPECRRLQLNEHSFRVVYYLWRIAEIMGDAGEAGERFLLLSKARRNVKERIPEVDDFDRRVEDYIDKDSEEASDETVC